MCAVIEMLREITHPPCPARFEFVIEMQREIAGSLARDRASGLRDDPRHHFPCHQNARGGVCPHIGHRAQL